MKTDTKFLFTLQGNMNKILESRKELAAIPDEPERLISISRSSLYCLARNYTNPKF